MAPGTDQNQRRSGNRTTWVVLGCIFVGSLIMGFVSYGQFMSSEQSIQADFDGMRERGASLDPEGCVDAVIAWHAECQAMKVLCDKSVGRMMEQCMAGADRHAYCAATDVSSNAHSGFGFKQCKARGAHEGKGKRLKKKVCGTAYRAIAYHCQSIQEKGGKS